ncbi:MAG: hypothetical protein ACOVP2_00620 [Armatimonadaceae bacterium]
MAFVVVSVINQSAIIDNITDDIDLKATVQRGNRILEKVKEKLALHPVGAPLSGTGNSYELDYGWCVTWLMLINQSETLDNIT